MNDKPIAMRDALLARIWQAMSEDSSIFFTCADFGSPVLDRIRADFKDRFVNVGIAEQNLINVSAGLALEGYKVFAYAIAPFITMRCYEQLRVSLALLSVVRPMNINLIGVGAGYSYVVSGPTHQCYEDITLIRALPNFRVLSPADHQTAAAMFDVCITNSGPKYMRLDAQVLPPVGALALSDIADGFRILRKGSRICLVSTGYMTQVSLKVADRLKADGIDITHVDLFDITHFSATKMEALLRDHRGIVTVEEGFRGRGGVDSLFFDFVNSREIPIRHLNLGVAGTYQFELGTRSVLHEQVGIGAETVYRAIHGFSAKL